MAYRLFLVLLLGVGIAYTLASRQIEMDPWSAAELINPATLPALLGMTFCSALILLLVASEPARPLPPQHPLRTLGLCGLILVFIASLAWLNLWISIGLLLVALAGSLGERRPRVLIALATMMPLGGYLLIEQLLDLRLPG